MGRRGGLPSGVAPSHLVRGNAINRRRRRNPLGRIAVILLLVVAVLAATEASGASTPPAVALGFSGSIAGTVADRDGEGTGFTSVQTNSAGTQLQAAQLDLAGGRLTVTTTAGDTQANTQQNALQTTFDGTAPYRVSATIRGPLALTHAFQGAGIFVGGGQDDHVKLMAGHGSSGPRLQLAKEQGGAFTSVAAPAAPAVASAATLSLTLTVNPATKAVVGAYSIDGGPLQTLGTTTLASLGTAGPRNRYRGVDLRAPVQRHPTRLAQSVRREPKDL